MDSSESTSSRSTPDALPSDIGSTKAGQVWLREERPRREQLTRDRIVVAALALLDTRGVEHLTMRRLAEHLGVGATTLYGHVRTKDDVLDLALDSVYAQIALPEDRTDDWRAEIVAVMQAWRSTLLRHPWSAHLLGRPQLGPHMLARQDAMLGTLARAGLTAETLSDAHYALSNYVIGSVLMHVAWQEQDATARWVGADHLRANADRYPYLAQHRSTPDTDWDRSFANGLTYLLDGVAANTERA